MYIMYILVEIRFLVRFNVYVHVDGDMVPRKVYCVCMYV